MHYIDTSVLVAYYCPESLSDKAESFIRKKGVPYLSVLSEVEFSSALAKKIRQKEMDPAAAKRVVAQLQAHLASEFFIRLTLEDYHYRLARDWIQLFKTPLRALDSLHLALASSHNLPVVTSDKNLVKSAKAVGIKVVWLHV